MKEGAIMVDTKEQIVQCIALKPAAFISLKQCKKCKNHIQVITSYKKSPNLKEGAPSPPDILDVVCNLPQRIRVHNRVDQKRSSPLALEGKADYLLQKLIIGYSGFLS